MDQFYPELKKRFKAMITTHHLLDEEILIKARVLTPKEAIGTPKRDDYPIIKGKEKLIEATFRGAKGQAFTDSYRDFSGKLSEVLNLNLDLTSNFNRAIFTASVNAVMRYLKFTDRSVHCRNDEMEECAKQFVTHIKHDFQNPKIGLIGLQPALVQELSHHFEIRVADMDDDNIGQKKCGVTIEDGRHFKELIQWCDLLLVTGSTAANGTIIHFVDIDKPLFFYGTTASGIATLMDLKKLCFCAS